MTIYICNHVICNHAGELFKHTKLIYLVLQYSTLDELYLHERNFDDS